ncbi:MAG: hypothetical protein ABSH02_03585 [Candidatus Sulfotelmatobacter sp.]|jgi:hypothetical protein
MSFKRWLCTSLVAVVAVAPVFAGTNDATDAKSTTSANTADAAAPAASPASPNPNPNPTPVAGNANIAALLGVLVMKGVLAPTEANAIRNAAPEAEFQLLVEALSRKGLLSAADLSAATTPATQPTAPAATPVAVPETVSASLSGPEASPQAQTKPQPPYPSRVAGELPPPPGVVTAVIPVRVFPIDPPKTGGLAGIKAGPITLAPYGFIKASIVHDSSDPDGDDFPFPGIWLNAGPNSTFNTGPTQDPEVHVKARSTRFGLNLEWPDISKNLTLTGKIEGDFEGNFSEADNRDVSSIRSNEPQLRLAFVRMDYHASESTDFLFVGGQDWTLFGSGALTNMFETTFNGAFWGDIYTRSPQLRVGLIQTLSKENNVKLEGQFGVMMPSTGEILKLGNAAGNGLAAQLGQGEREGADADRPEYEARAALSFQLDKAKGVSPAQIALAGFHSRRTSIVPNSSYCTAAPCAANTTLIPANYDTAFPNGFQGSSAMWGGQITVQLPTRWATLVASAYKGADMRFYFGGQINSFYTDVSGLTNVVGPFETADGGPLAAQGGTVLGTNAAGQVVAAPQKPIQAFGGFVQLGLPLSRWFNADPHGHNAGWQLLFTIGKDQVVDKDQLRANGIGCAAADGSASCNGGLPLSMGKMALATLYYKFNNWCQFGFEQSVYGTRLFDHLTLYTIAGQPSNEWQDHRTEFGPIFTF